MNKEILEKVSQAEGLQVVATTTDRTGYPRGEGWALTGFDSWEQAVRVSSEHGLELFWGFQKDGWHHWYVADMAMHPMTYTEAYNGDNYRFLDTIEEYKEELEEDVREDVQAMRDYEDVTEEEIHAFIEKVTKENENTLKQVASDYSEGDVIVIYCGEYYGTCPKEMLAFSEDTKNYKLIAYEY